MTVSDRNYPDWLTAYCQYASYSEAPRRMHLWSGVSAIAGALQRHVWIDMRFFKWYPNEYIILVAPPGVVAKSTTSDISMELLKQVPGVHFGPTAVTGPALIDKFSEVQEEFEYPSNIFTPQAALTIQSSEMGNLLDPNDRVLVDWLVDLWDSKTGPVAKSTRGTGTVEFSNPFLNIIACTTPTWLQGNMPEHMIGGGFTSRCIFIYADTKEKLVAYPFLIVPKDQEITHTKLIHDLIHIHQKVRGPFAFTQDALKWGIEWYKVHNASPPEHLQDKRFRYYLARKQSHLHKLAMVLCVSRSDQLLIKMEDLILAERLLIQIEADLPHVFEQVGRTNEAMHMQRLMDFIQSKPQGVLYKDAYLHIHAHFPAYNNFVDHLTGAIQAGLVKQFSTKAGLMLQFVGKPAAESARSPNVQPEEPSCTSDLLSQQIVVPFTSQEK